MQAVDRAGGGEGGGERAGRAGRSAWRQDTWGSGGHVNTKA